MKLAYSLTSSIVFFITASIAFIAIKYSSRPKAVPKPGDIPSNSWIVTAVYIFITLLAQIIANFSNAKTICRGSSQSFGLVLLYTLIPYFLILGTVMALIVVFPAWLTPFSNTIGYAAVSVMGLQTVFNKLLAVGPEKKDASGKLHPPNELIKDICSDKSLLINEMTGDNYADFMAAMAGNEDSAPKSISESSSAQATSAKPKELSMLVENYEKKPEYYKLFSLVLLKNIISEGLWYILAGCLAISIANNVLINIQCNYNPKEMQKMNESMKASQAKMHADRAKNPPLLYTKHT